jgi:thiamine-monophosphate kinase
MHALSDGEDFELLFVVSPEDGAKLLRDQPLQDLGTSLYHIGICIRDGIYIRYENGRQESLPPLGYLHEFG